LDPQVAEHHRGDCNRKAQQPYEKEETKDPREDIDGALSCERRVDVLAQLEVDRRAIGSLFGFDPSQVEDYLDDGQDQHRDTDGERIEAGLEPPILGLINENNKEDKEYETKYHRRSNLQIAILLNLPSRKA
jgi:hypothetical protein